jgi:hypothetical protein
VNELLSERLDHWKALLRVRGARPCDQQAHCRAVVVLHAFGVQRGTLCVPLSGHEGGCACTCCLMGGSKACRRGAAGGGGGVAGQAQQRAWGRATPDDRLPGRHAPRRGRLRAQGALEAWLLLEACRNMPLDGTQDG